MDITKQQKHLNGFYRHKILQWFSRHATFVRRLLLWLGIPLAVVIIAGFIPFSNSALRAKVEKMLVKSFVTTCSIQRVTLTPWLGFAAEGIEATKKDNGMLWQIKVPRVRVSYRIIPLLFRFVVIKNFALEKPQVRLALPSSMAADPGKGKAFSSQDVKDLLAGSPFSVVIKNISLDNGDIAVEQRGKPVAGGREINLRMSVRFKKELMLSGRMSARCITLSGLWDIENVRANLKVNGLSATLDGCKGDFYNGKITASGEADLGESVLNGFRAEIARVDLAKLYEGSHIRQGTCEGRLDAKVELSQSALEADSLKGRGKVSMSKVAVHDLPLQNNLVVFVAIPQIRNITFSKLATSLEIHNGKVFTPDIRGDGYPLEIRADGWVGFEGYFAEKMDGIFSADLVRSFHPVISRSLDDAEDGKKSFKCTVSGKFKNPKIDIDRKIQERAVNNVIDEVRKFFSK
jgi:uncharacterized protein involved in outer membrane biogenesis